MNTYNKISYMEPSKFYSYFMIICLLSLLFLFPPTFTFPYAWPQCHSAEHAALLQFKESFVIDCRYASQSVPFAYPKTVTWNLEGNGSDCCSWNGVECDEGTGHVIGLDLNASCLYGSIGSNSSLFHLLHLQYLNLAYNNFNHSRIPSAIGNLSALNHLQLSNSRIFGQIPSEITRLSKLSHLDLSTQYIHGIYPSVKLLELKNPDLRSLIQNLSSLEYLHLGCVDISSRIPDILANLSSLRSLSLYNCGLQGSIPISIFSLKNLERLSIYENNLRGIVDVNTFLPLKKLKVLILSYNNLVFLDENSNNETLPELTWLGLSSCSLRAFPLFLKEQNKLQRLNLAWNYLHGKIPSWIWTVSLGTLNVLILSNNYLTSLGLLPTPLPWPNLRVLELDSNLLEGPLPIPSFSTIYYIVSNNSFFGEIPEFICKLSSLEVLDLSSNNLTGPIPRCLGNFSSSLSILNLENNNLCGTIPPAWTNNNNTRMISFGQNKLQGQLPRSLASCKMLEILDLGNNQLNDTFPSWMGTLPELKVLILRLNMFHGKIGPSETSFSFLKLQILDLSSNDFSGKLPVEYFLCRNAMQDEDDDDQLKYMQADISHTILGEWVQYYYIYSMTMTNKGIEMDYSRIVRILRVLDFSCNKFEGDIPVLIGNLKGLHLLNLSNNILSGFIPPSIGNLAKLEALDLSQNRLSGEIPQQLVQLSFLEVFNVSHNHLTGDIPQGKQFDTFQNNSFDGNPGLCGEPLSVKCENSKALPPAPPPTSDESFGLDWKFVPIGYACGFVFGTVIGHIVIERKRDWFMNFFRVRQPSRQRRTRRRRIW